MSSAPRALGWPLGRGQRADILVRRARLLVKQERLKEALEIYRAALAASENPVAEAAAEVEVLVQRFRLEAIFRKRGPTSHVTAARLAR